MRLDAAEATGAILNDDMEPDPVDVRVLDATATEGNPLTFTVQLSRAFGSDLELGWCFGRSGILNENFESDPDLSGTVTVPAGDTTAMFSLGTPRVDGTVEPPNDRIEVEIYGGGLDGCDSAPALPEGVRLARSVAMGTILDGDSVTVSVSIEGGDTVAEGDAVEFTVRLTNPLTAPIAVDWTVLAGIADTASTDDFEPESLTGTAMIPMGSMAVTFPVMTRDDDVTEGDETFTVELRAPPGGFPEGVRLAEIPPLPRSDDLLLPTAVATIVENAAPGIPVVMDQNARTGEPFEYDFDPVSDANGDDVTYRAALSDGGALPDWLAFDPAMRTFSGTPQEADIGTITVLVTATDNGTLPMSSTAEFTITVMKSSRTLTGFAYSPAMVQLGQDAPTLTAPMVDPPLAEGAALTYASGDTDVCTVDANDGTVMLVAAGSCVITVTASATSTHSEGSATFTIMVMPGTTLDEAQVINEAVTPEVARAVAANAVGAVAGRVSAAVSSSAAAGGFSFNGHSSLEDAMVAHAQTMAGGGKDIKDILNGADFVLPLNAAGGGSGASALSLWGSGEYRNLGGEDKDLDWDGDLFSAHLGVDGRLPNGMLAGAAVSWSESDLDYDLAGDKGDYELDLTAVHPYLGWTSPDGLGNMWATVGYGQGELEITPDGRAGSDSDVDAMMTGVGGSREVLRSGGARLRIKGEVLYSEMEVDASDDGEIRALEVNASRVRLSAQLSRPRTTANGARIVSPK